MYAKRRIWKIGAILHALETCAPEIWKHLLRIDKAMGGPDEERVTRHHLDRILPDRPFLMFAPDHHIAWANTIALTQAGILEGRDVGVGNEIVMGADGLANGELRESNANGTP